VKKSATVMSRSAGSTSSFQSTFARSTLQTSLWVLGPPNEKPAAKAKLLIILWRHD
jgi:hypothetical protein